MPEHNQTPVSDIRKTIELNAPIQKVWEAVSTSEGIAAWLMPNDFQPIVGVAFTIRSPYGDSPCKVTELDPPNRLAFSWGKDWHVSFDLKDLGGKTEFTLIHSGWSDTQVTEVGEAHSVVRDRMDHGWEASVLPRLRQLVEGQ